MLPPGSAATPKLDFGIVHADLPWTSTVVFSYLRYDTHIEPYFHPWQYDSSIEIRALVHKVHAMTQLTILKFPDARLRNVARPVDAVDDSIRKLAGDMLETMYGSRGIGLAATQVNRSERVLVLDISEERDQPQVLINPEIVGREGSQTCEEGCLSVPGEYAEVERAEWIRVRALDRDGASQEFDAEGLLAVCIQHEIDHLDGRVFVDYLSPLKRRMIEKRLKKARAQQREPARQTVL